MRILTTFRFGQILIWSTRKKSIKTSIKNQTQYVKAVVRPSRIQSNLFRNHLTFTLLSWLPLNNKIIILTILSHIIITVIFCQLCQHGHGCFHSFSHIANHNSLHRSLFAYLATRSTKRTTNHLACNLNIQRKTGLPKLSTHLVWIK